MEREKIVQMFSDIMHKSDGIEGLFAENIESDIIFNTISMISEDAPLTKVQLDQILMLNYTKGMSNDFFNYYWISIPSKHFYDVKKVEGYSEKYIDKKNIESLKQLKWGFYRLFIDLLFAFGNINMGYEKICDYNNEQLVEFYEQFVFNNEKFRNRSKTIKFETIDENDKYLISEMACKTLAVKYSDQTELEKFIREKYKKYILKHKKIPDLRTLIQENDSSGSQFEQMSLFVTEEEHSKEIKSEDEISNICGALSKRFDNAKKAADKNTKLYLSLINDLDVYVATSMRTKNDFINMSRFCKDVFTDNSLKKYQLRYFDPTISSTNSHEDKGLIECLMVKSAKVLIYNSDSKESYGKDVEAAMALSSGKPVIFYCNEQKKMDFYRDVHPLSRLINMKNGVAGGTIVCSSKQEVIDILHKLFSDDMEYTVEQKKNHSGYYLLKEKTTGSVVRVQTNDKLISSSFWNYYDTLVKIKN